MYKLETTMLNSHIDESRIDRDDFIDRVYMDMCVRAFRDLPEHVIKSIFDFKIIDTSTERISRLRDELVYIGMNNPERKREIEEELNEISSMSLTYPEGITKFKLVTSKLFNEFIRISNENNG